MARETMNNNRYAARGVRLLAAILLVGGTVSAVPAAAERGSDAGVKLVAETAAKTKKFGDWAVVCPDEEGKKAGVLQCRLVQSAILNVEGKDGAETRAERVMLTVVGYIADSPQPILSVIVPLGVLVAPGLRLDVEGYDQLQLPLQRCDTEGCVAVLPMKEHLVEAFRRGKEAQVTFVNAAAKGNRIRISLTGFGKGLESLGKPPKKKEPAKEPKGNNLAEPEPS